MCVGFWQCLSADAWLQTFGGLAGAFVGTLLAGLISLKLYQRESADQRKATYRQFKRNYFLYYRNKLNSFLNLMGRSPMEAADPNDGYVKVRESIGLVNRYYMAVMEPYVPLELYHHFETIYEQLLNIETVCKMLQYGYDYQEVMKVMVGSIVEESIEEITGAISYLDHFLEENY